MTKAAAQMTVMIGNDDEGHWAVDRPVPDPTAAYSEIATATAGWRRSIPMAAADRALSWTAFILVVIAVLSPL